MWWFIAIVVLILFVVSAGFRKFALALVAIAVIGGFIIHQNNKREEQLSRQRISLHQLIFENVKLKNTNYGDFNLTGRIHNESKQYTLTDIDLNLTIRDCIKGKDCIIIGETTEHIYINIPPGQVRDFQESVYVSGDKMNPKGDLVYDYKVAYTEAK